MRQRLQKVLASAGVASRRSAEALIAAGEVLVNGRVAKIGDQVDPDVDLISLRGQTLDRTAARVYLALNKPTGYVTSTRATHGEGTVLDLVPIDQPIYPVGRLDKDTSGLLLLTNDGDWANLVTHPRYGIEKEYTALVNGCPSDAALTKLRQGIALTDGSTTAPASVTRMDDYGGRRLKITLIEGKKRQIRLMFHTVGHPVIELCRTRVGTIRLNGLREAEWRYLTHHEVKSIRELAGERAQAPG